MPCPGNNCKGYLSTQYKCELCKLFTCPDCFEIIGYLEDQHVCKDENIKSAEMIKKKQKVVQNVVYEFLRLVAVIKCGVLNVKLHLVGILEKLLLVVQFTILIIIIIYNKMVGNALKSGVLFYGGSISFYTTIYYDGFQD